MTALVDRLGSRRSFDPWSPSTIYGSAKRGTGILNNELYVGRLVWNRLRYVKNPDTGKRVSRLNPESEWMRKEVAQLRIVSDETWANAKRRQENGRKAAALSAVDHHGKLVAADAKGRGVWAGLGGELTCSQTQQLVARLMTATVIDCL